MMYACIYHYHPTAQRLFQGKRNHAVHHQNLRTVTAGQFDLNAPLLKDYRLAPLPENQTNVDYVNTAATLCFAFLILKVSRASSKNKNVNNFLLSSLILLLKQYYLQGIDSLAVKARNLLGQLQLCY